MQKYLIVGIGVVLISLIIIGIIFTGKNAKREFDQFNSTNISGIIESVYIKHRMTAFRLKGDSNEYIFAPYTSSLNNNHIFHLFVAKGDSVYKQSYSDTVRLIRNERNYFYEFQKF